MPTPSQTLAEVLLDRPLDDWAAELRREGRSWRLIARALYEATSGRVDVTGETLRGWLVERISA